MKTKMKQMWRMFLPLVESLLAPQNRLLWTVLVQPLVRLLVRRKWLLVSRRMSHQLLLQVPSRSLYHRVQPVVTDLLNKQGHPQLQKRLHSLVALAQRLLLIQTCLRVLVLQCH